MKEVMAMVIVTVIFYFIYKIFELFVHRQERINTIEKISVGIDLRGLDSQFLQNKSLFQKNKSDSSWTIRIGMLLLGAGLGVFIATIVDVSLAPPTSYHNDNVLLFREAVNIFYPACAAFFGGIGLVSAYFIEKKGVKKEE